MGSGRDVCQRGMHPQETDAPSSSPWPGNQGQCPLCHVICLYPGVDKSQSIVLLRKLVLESEFYRK